MQNALVKDNQIQQVSPPQLPTTIDITNGLKWVVKWNLYSEPHHKSTWNSPKKSVYQRPLLDRLNLTFIFNNLLESNKAVIRRSTDTIDQSF